MAKVIPNKMSEVPLKSRSLRSDKTISLKNRQKSKKLLKSEPKADPYPLSRIIKKYPNRRLYDTLNSAYITLTDIKSLVMSHEIFQVIDVKTNEEITRSILMQIILEEESSGTPLLSSESLLSLIRFYGNSLQGMIAPFLEKNLNQFGDLQNQYLSYCKNIGGAITPETWLSFNQQNTASNFASPFTNFFEVGTMFLEQIQSQTNGLLIKFPFNIPPKTNN